MGNYTISAELNKLIKDLGEWELNESLFGGEILTTIYLQKDKNIVTFALGNGDSMDASEILSKLQRVITLFRAIQNKVEGKPSKPEKQKKPRRT